jgi:ribonuclease P protein component
MRFRPEQHLRRQSDIRAVREQGRRVDCRAFTIWWKRRETPAADKGGNASDLSAPSDVLSAQAAVAAALAKPAPRVCVIASTAAVGHAVRRNRAKRRLREIFRHQQHLVPAGCDLLLIARAAAIDRPIPELAQKFSDACNQIASSSKPASSSP